MCRVGGRGGGSHRPHPKRFALRPPHKGEVSLRNPSSKAQSRNESAHRAYSFSPTGAAAMHAFSKEITACIDACFACQKTCMGLAMTHCLEMGGEHVAPKHFRLMIDCAAICAT